MFAECWGSPLIVEDRVYIGDTDGEICIFKLAPEMELLSEVNMGSSVVATPVVANGIMFIANRNRVFAIQEGAKSEPVK
jgi:outer membrane protein assembly factor BamB